MDLLIFHSSRIVSLLVHQIYLVVFRVVKVLGCLIKHMHLVDVIHIDLFLHVLSKLDILVKASPSWAGSWISWSLSLPLYALDDFPGLWVNPAKWIHTLTILRENITPRSSLCWSSVWRSNLLSSGSMLHILLVEGWSHVQIWVRTGYDWLSLVAAYVMRVLLSLPANSVKVIMNVQVLGLVHDVCYPCCRVSLWVLLDSFGQYLSWNMSLLSVRGQIDLHFLFEFLSWGFGRKLITPGNNWGRHDIYGLHWWLWRLLFLFPSHHLL